MSQRGKRQASRLDDGPVATKRRKGRPVAVAEEEEATLEGWTPRSQDIKISTIYNRSTTEPPAELFRKDLISAMKLPDSEPLSADEYWVITDQWKQEWEKGVQVPVNPDSLPGPSVTVVSQSVRSHHSFKLPKSKYIRITKDDSFKPDEHSLSPYPLKAEKVCSYDLDNVDIAWLKIINGERAVMGQNPIREDQFERVIAELELRSWDKVQTIVKSEEGLGIEYDENVICDVCRSPDSEDGNEMVFCDSCNICVHQACYGITTIPAGSFLCRTCTLGMRPECVLCPNRGGAMKCTRSGHKWAHVSCALWIPEVSIGCVEKMEPITKISSIPQSRWALICVLCRERVGACIQCSVKTCKVAYHVTCAFKHGLEMRAIIEDENADDGVKLRSYCEKHSVTPRRDRGGTPSEDDDRRKKRKDMTSEEKNQARAAKLQEIEAEFEKYVSPSDVSKIHEVDSEGITAIYNYWVIKRRAGKNKPLLAPRPDDLEYLSKQQEQADHEKLKKFVQLRQDLERVRNLCYMVSRREKLSRTLFKMREQTFHKQIAVLSNPDYNLSPAEIAAVRESNHGPSLYDRLYSHAGAPELSTDFETLLERIAGRSHSGKEKGKIDRNGMRKEIENPYKRMYVNGGLERRRSLYASMSSGSDTDIKRPAILDTSSTEERAMGRRDVKGKRLIKKRPMSRPTVETSTEDESKSSASPRSKGLSQMEKELGDKTGSDDSDDLIAFSQVKKDSRGVTNIYSDTDSDSSMKDGRESSHPMRTKAAVKEFTNQRKHKKSQLKSLKTPNRSEKESKPKHLLDDEFYRDKENVNFSKKKKRDSPSDLIVPQRQAAKKASESLRQGKVKDSVLVEQDAIKTMTSVDDNKIKSKPLKTKAGKELGKEKKEDRPKSFHNDIYEFDKDLCGDAQDIIAYVPQRQAARKATENIKSGLNKPVAPSNDPESDSNKVKSNDSKSKREIDLNKSKKDLESEKNKKFVRTPEPKQRKTSKSSVSSSSTSSSSSSSSGSSSSSSSSSSDSEEEEQKSIKLPLDKKSLFDPVPIKDENKQKSVEKKGVQKKFEISAFLDKGKSIHSSTTSSSDSEDQEKLRAKKNEILNKLKPDPLESRKENTKREDGRRDDSNLKVGSASKKLRKTPEKKLKTSDGRPELEFQQPPTERKESSRTQESSRRSEEKDTRKHKTERNSIIGHSETQSVNNSNKVQPAKDTGDRNKLQDTFENRHKSKTPDRSRSQSTFSDKSKSETVKRDGQKPKEDHKEIPGRKRKPDDVEKQSPTHKSQRKPSPHPTDASSIEEKTGQHSPAPSKKVDKKIDSPVKKPEEYLASTLEREMAERKAGRDIFNRSNSKKSLDRLFEKRDKLVRENERKEQNALLRNSTPIPSKSPEKLPNKTPDKIHSQSPLNKEIIIRDENKNEKLSDSSSWAAFDNNNSSNLLETVQAKVEPPDSPVQNQRSLFSPIPENIIEEGNITEVKKTEDDSNVHSAPPVLIKEVLNDSFPHLSPPPTSSDGLYKSDAIPQLEKVDNLGTSELPNLETIKTEPKKISSRTSSLSAPSQPQSIFSPQPPKDPSVSEFFDLEHEFLGVDEDNFGMPRDSEERGPVSFSFNNDFIFKIDSKEENARETMNLVEKLRLGFAKKPNSEGEGEGENADNKSSGHAEELEELDRKPHEEIQVDPTPVSEPSLPPQTINSHEDALSLIEPCIADDIKQTLDIDDATKNMDHDTAIGFMKPIIDEAAVRLGADSLLLHSVEEKQDIPQYETNDHYQYSNYPLPIDVGKVPGREKLDRSNSAQADERWVPPSIPPSVHSTYEAPSPYGNKWAEDELMPSRHSSSSSASSTSSSSHREEIEQQKHDDLVPSIGNASMIPEIPHFPALQPPIAYNPSCALANHPFHFPDGSSFPGSFIQPPNCSQLSFPGGTGLFPPNFPPFPSQLPLVNKLPDEPVHMPPPHSAAFTTSSQNIALTAAIVSGNLLQEPPPLTPLPFPAQENCQQITPDPIPPPTPENFNHQPPASVSSEEPATPKSSGKKSPQKPTRISARCIAQQTKSPAKSPGKSPRQLDSRGRGKDGGGKRGRPPGRGGVNQRARGRGRGRGRGHALHADNTIASKLVGTVYDFDFDEDEEGGDSLENLRAMRERRKSSDVHEKKSDISFFSKDSPNSPKLTSPLHHKGRTGYGTETKILSPGLNHSKTDTLSTRPVDIVEPLLPGPVDMRTYSSFTSSTSTYQNHLLEPFPSVPPPEITNEYVAELEEEIKTLRGSTATKLDDVPKVIVNDLPHVSVDDSRNQLKVKIKGPFLDANYAASSVNPVQPPLPSVTQSEGATVPLGPASSITSSGGTSNLRRMRKKELLRQYWTQDMNMDDPVPIPPPVPVTQDPLVNRNVITIPKAVASMPIVPTREDYKAVVDANMEKKRKKEKNLSLRDSDEIIERRKSISSIPEPEIIHQPKRRGRQPKNNTPTPKLKIKIRGDGSNEMSVSECSEERKNLRVRPPKKRLTNVTKPTVEEMKRESMKFRKMVMAGFEEDEDEVIEERSRKRKKKSFDDTPIVSVIADEAAPKLIIKFSKRIEEDPPPPPPPPVESEPLRQPSSECDDRTSDDNPAVKKVRTSNKIMPIKLKLSRCEEGYVMKVPICDSVDQSGSELSSTERRDTPSLPLSKDCEVR